LKKNEAKELYDVPFSEYVPLNSPSLDGESAYRREMEAYGRKATALIVYNPELEKGQMQGILINIRNAEEKLQELQQRLIRREIGEITKGKKPTIESITKNVEKTLAAEYMRDVFSYKLVEKDNNVLLDYELSAENLDCIRRNYLGKTVLFTDRSDFTNEQIVLAYRSSWRVESAFRQLKNPNHLTVRPIFHWTDEKIRVHIFICVLAYRLCCLLIKELSEHGVYLSINRLMEETSRIKKVQTFFGDLKKPQRVLSFTRGSDIAERIEQLYNLKEQYC
jgi:transposase